MKNKKIGVIIGVIVLIVIIVVISKVVLSPKQNDNATYDLLSNSKISDSVVQTENTNFDNDSRKYVMYDYVKEFAVLEYPSKNDEWSYNVYADNTDTYKNKFVELTECNIDRDATTISIPDEIEGYPVICMGDNLLSNYKELENLTIPNTIINIGDKACYECNSLSNINIPSSVTVIGDNAFTYHGFCGIGELKIPEGVIEIGKSAFYTDIGKEGYYNENVGFTKVVLPKSLERISYNAFQTDEVVVLNPNLEFVTSYEEDFVFNYNAVVYSYSGSTAAKYCAARGNTFKLIEEN